MHLNKDEIDNFGEKLHKFLVKKGQIKIRIRYTYSVSDLAKKFRVRPDSGLDPQHW